MLISSAGTNREARVTRVTLVGITHIWPDTNYRDFFCLAPAYLKLYAESQKELAGSVSVQIEDYRLSSHSNDALEDVAELIAAGKPALVGFSCYLWTMAPIMKLCRLLKTKNRNLRIVLGGPDVAARGVEFLRSHGDVDYICFGEGEKTFAELLARLHRDQDVSGVRGLIWRQGEEIVREAEMPPLEDLSGIPSPYLKGIVPVRDGELLTIETTRGCPYICKYCDWQNGQPTRNFPVDRVLDEVEAVITKAKNVLLMVADADIFTDLPRAKKLIKGFRRLTEHRPDVLFLIQLYIPRLDEEMFELLNTENFLLGAGVQSTNPAVLKSISRFFDKEKVERGVKLWRRAAPRARLALHLISGLPGESVASFRSGLQWALSQRASKVEIYASSSLPGAAFGKNPEAFGIVAEKLPPYRILSTDAASDGEIEDLRRWCFMFRLLIDAFPQTHGMEDLADELGVESLTLWDEFIARVSRVPELGLERAFSERDPFDSGFFNASTRWMQDARASGALDVLHAYAAEFIIMSRLRTRGMGVRA